MPQSLAQVAVHLVFSTKHREPFIRPDCRDRTFSYLAGILNALDCRWFWSAARSITFTCYSACRGRSP